MSRTLLGLTLLLAACGAPLDQQPEDLPLDEVYRVELSGSLVGVELEGGDALAVDTSLRWSGRRNRPELSHVVVDGVLQIRGACPEDSDRCEVVHRLVVPDDVRVAMDLEQVNLQIRDVAHTDTRILDGAVQLDGWLGEADLSATSTDIDGLGLALERLSLRTTGSVDLSFDEAPTELSIDNDLSVLLRVPAGGYRLDLASRMGRVETRGVYHIDDATSTLRVRSGAGHVLVYGESNSSSAAP